LQFGYMSNNLMKAIFKSKLSPFSLIIFLIVLVMGILLLTEGNFFGSIIICLLLVFFIYLYKSTEYIITTDDRLIVNCGFLIHEEMDIKSILRISATRSILAAPAFSFDRMIISSGLFHSVVISPVNKDLFLQKLLMINPDIDIEI
jgi:predicted membrane channel-forming protein YqfA (hemolysin III family)